MIQKIVFILSIEVISILIFYLLSKLYDRRLNLINVVKGFAERLFLFLALINQLPQALILFGALKIATSINTDKNSPKDYYFLGNIVSVLLVIIYYMIWKFDLNT